MENDKFQEVLESQKWKEAKTYSKIAPHEYILKFQNKKLFKLMHERIIDTGVNEDFTIYGHTKSFRYLYFKGYKYWIVDIVLNRVKEEEDVRVVK